MTTSLDSLVIQVESRFRWLAEQYELFFAGHPRATRRPAQMYHLLEEARELNVRARRADVPERLKDSVRNAAEFLAAELGKIHAAAANDKLVMVASVVTMAELHERRYRRCLLSGCELTDFEHLDRCASDLGCTRKLAFQVALDCETCTGADLVRQLDLVLADAAVALKRASVCARAQRLGKFKIPEMRAAEARLKFRSHLSRANLDYPGAFRTELARELADAADDCAEHAAGDYRRRFTELRVEFRRRVTEQSSPASPELPAIERAAGLISEEILSALRAGDRQDLEKLADRAAELDSGLSATVPINARPHHIGVLGRFRDLSVVLERKLAILN